MRLDDKKFNEIYHDPVAMVKEIESIIEGLYRLKNHVLRHRRDIINSVEEEKKNGKTTQDN